MIFARCCIAASAALLSFAGTFQPARAALHLCNRTSYVLYTAYGYRDGTNIATKGWVRAAPGSCATAIASALKNTTYYVYAQTSRAHAGAPHNWAGNKPLCARHGSFSFLTSVLVPGCFAEDAFALNFSAVEPKRKKNWTSTFTEPSLGTLPEAQAAGLQRLLDDNGFKAGSPGDKNAKSLSDALSAFRAREKLSAGASDDQLFSRLESGALKNGAPAGYSICNGAKQALWAAIAFKTSVNWTVQGWWKVPAAACATTINAPLSFDSVFVHAEFSPSKPVVSGAAKFCITDIQFDVHDRDRCKAHGLQEAGFAETETKGRTGFVAHIGPSGLLPPAPAAAAKPVH